MSAPQETALWKAAFANKHCKTPSQKASRGRLLVELSNLEEHVKSLIARIPEDCKGLTLHDISHVHQLWDVASTLCGANYPINPLEGFILGAAFLIHDAGLTAAAYPGGVPALKRSTLYRDLVANALKRANPDRPVEPADIDNAPAEIAERALFETLRRVHADRAEKLLEREYKHPLTDSSFTIVPPEVLLDFGEAIGKIAASHHWDLKKVDHTFDQPDPPPADYAGWTVDACKLACILRTADASAIDHRRARIMAFIIENPRGVSRSHWAFQAYLNPGHLPNGSEALVFRSKRAFPRSEMDAWWVGYDAIGVADRELRDCDRLLKRRAGRDGHHAEIPLDAKRVAGAGDAEELQRYVTANDWKPVDTSARIGDPLAVIEKLGGAALYGDDSSAPLRELLQNAADAIRARRGLGGYSINPGDFPGEIEIQVVPPADSSDRWTMRIVDDGIGMPEDVLTGEFLDFGKSLWRSDRLASLYPGLAGQSSFRPTGRFGIGFYATFMIADDVKIITKPFRGSYGERTVLHFKNGVKGRAELRPYAEREDGQWPLSASTIIELRLKDRRFFYGFSRFKALLGHTVYKFGEEDFDWAKFGEAIRRLVFALDVQVLAELPSISREAMNNPSIFSAGKLEFITEWNKVFAGSGIQKRGLREQNLELIATVGNLETSKTRGMIINSQDHASINGIIHIGGFTMSDANSSYIEGVAEGLPIATNRSKFAYLETRDSFLSWGLSQYNSSSLNRLDDSELSIALMGLWNLGIELGSKYFLWEKDNGMLFYSDIIFDCNTEFFFCADGSLSRSDGPRISPIIMPDQIGREYEKSFTYLLENRYSQLSGYNKIDIPRNLDCIIDRTAFGRLLSLIREHGFEFEIAGPELFVVGRYTGPDGGTKDSRLRDPSLKHGDPVKQRGVVVRVKPK